MDVIECVTDDDYEAWRRVRMEVVPGERTDTVAELRVEASADRMMVLASLDGLVVGSGMAGVSGVGGGFVAPRVRPAYRRRGVGSAVLGHLAAHLTSRGFERVRAMVDDPGSLVFAERAGFVEVDRQVEQVLAIADEVPPPSAPPVGVRVIDLAEQPQLWPASYDTFAREVLADFALDDPLQVSAEQWASSEWAGDPMFLALHDGKVIGCAGLHLDTDRPERAENALTAVSREWRGRGVASYLKRLTLRWAAEHEVTEVYTWTQARNESMLRLNEHLGYVVGQTSISVSRPLPL
jgi:GNAT superfamily N-acetyltransferase